MQFVLPKKILPVLTLLLSFAWMLSPVMPVQAQVQEQEGSGVPLAYPSSNKRNPFPYALLNYTQAAHDQRIMNAPVIVLGQIESCHEIKGTEKSLNWAVWLRVETFLRTDRPGQENSERLFFRCLPVTEEFKRPIDVGDRCLVLLGRDLRSDNALILTTDMHYYPVTQEGKVHKFMKTGPTENDPALQELPVHSFLKEIKSLLQRISMETQCRDSDLVMIGRVIDSRQGLGNAGDYMYVQFEAEKVFKGDPGEEVVTFIQKANPYRWTLQTLNRAAFVEGQRVLCIGNKDPAYSKPGIWNPSGETLHVFPFQRISSLFLASSTAWRRGFRPIPLEQLYEDLARWTGSGSAGE